MIVVGTEQGTAIFYDFWSGKYNTQIQVVKVHSKRVYAVTAVVPVWGMREECVLVTSSDARIRYVSLFLFSER